MILALAAAEKNSKTAAEKCKRNKSSDSPIEVLSILWGFKILNLVKVESE